MAKAAQNSMTGLLVWGLAQAHERLESLVSDLTPGQLAWSPTPGSHSLCFALWHVARCDDNYLRVHIQGRPEVWQEEGWFQRWGLDRESTGMLLPDQEASALRLPGREELLAYAQRVWGELEGFVAGLDAEGLARPVEHVQRTRGLTTGQVLLTHIYGHDSRHMGEMEYIKGLMGLRGSITL